MSNEKLNHNISTLASLVSNQKQNRRKSSQSKDTLIKDIERLKRSNISSVEFAISITTAMVEDLLQRLRRDNPHDPESLILQKAREILSLGRRDN